MLCCVGNSIEGLFGEQAALRETLSDSPVLLRAHMKSANYIHTYKYIEACTTNQQTPHRNDNVSKGWHATYTTYNVVLYAVESSSSSSDYAHEPW